MADKIEKVDDLSFKLTREQVITTDQNYTLEALQEERNMHTSQLAMIQAKVDAVDALIVQAKKLGILTKDEFNNKPIDAQPVGEIKP